MFTSISAKYFREKLHLDAAAQYNRVFISSSREITILFV